MEVRKAQPARNGKKKYKEDDEIKRSPTHKGKRGQVLGLG